MKAFTFKTTWAAIIIAFAAGFSSAYFFTTKNEIKQIADERINKLNEQRQNSGYQFINPLIECDNYFPENNASQALIKSEIESYSNELLAAKKATQISVYYRDLNNGSWLGINENEHYSPASLLKVPIMIAALKKCEKEPSFLKKKIKFERYIDNVIANIIDTGWVQLGKSYTVEELIVKMIAYSDNEAKNLLLLEIGDKAFNQTFIDAGIAPLDFKYKTDIITVKEYSSFFRLLYNATYLNKELSEKALSILSKSDFKNGLVAGIPQGITISHKFGERAFNENNIKQLHDCGIVYLNNEPYLICVMTRGFEFDELAKIIANISKIVYTQVSK
jgi:beta-lactamase class A